MEENIYKDPITNEDVKESDIKCEICGEQISRGSIAHRIHRYQSLKENIRCYYHRNTVWINIKYNGKLYSGGIHKVASDLCWIEGIKCAKCGEYLSESAIAHRIQRKYDFSKPMLCNSCNWNSNEHRLFRIYKLSLKLGSSHDIGYFYFAETEDPNLFKFGVTTSISHRCGAFGSTNKNYTKEYEAPWEEICRLEYEIKKKFTSEETFNLYGSNEILPNSYRNKIRNFIKTFDYSKLQPLEGNIH